MKQLFIFDNGNEEEWFGYKDVKIGELILRQENDKWKEWVCYYREKSPIGIVYKFKIKLR
jgi:hypothetical protein